MNKKQADAIYRLTAQPEWVQVDDWLQSRLASLHRDLETYNNVSDIARLQGECVALRALLALRDKATAILET